MSNLTYISFFCTCVLLFLGCGSAHEESKSESTPNENHQESVEEIEVITEGDVHIANTEVSPSPSDVKGNKMSSVLTNGSNPGAVPEYNNPLSGFEIDTLSSAQLVAFERRAIEKVKDFVEYVSLVSDKSIDKAMRKQALAIVQEMFVDSAKSGCYDKNEHEILMNDWLKGLMKLKAQLSFNLNAVVPVKAPVPQGKFYKGSFEFQVEAALHEIEAYYPISYYIVKVEKVLGKEKVKVWEVRLGTLPAGWAKYYLKTVP